MTNRDKYFNKMDPYDLLARMQRYQKEYGRERVPCVLDMIAGQIKPCDGENCYQCIQQWLNEEAL